MEVPKDELLFTDVYTWGERIRSGFYVPNSGQIENPEAPMVLEVFEMKRVIQVASSNDGTLALTANGEVWGWGPVFVSGYRRSFWGAERPPENEEEMKNSWPHRIQELVDYKVRKIAATTPGESKTMFAVITDEGLLLTWCGRVVRATEDDDDEDNWKALLPLFPEGTKVIDVALGEDDGICMLENRDVYTWQFIERKPRLINQLFGIPIRQIDAGGQEWFAVVTEENDLYTWGISGGSSNGDYLGHGQIKDQPDPKLVEALQGKVKFVKCGYIHTGAVTVDGDVYTWGDCDTNRLGHGARRSGIHLPVLNKTLSGKGVIQLSHARGNEAALTESGELYVWGGNSFGGQFNYSIPTPFPLWNLRGNQIRQVSCGRAHTTLLTTRRLTLKDVCVRYLCNNMSSVPDFVWEDTLPEELREYMALYLLDRRRLTVEIIRKMGLSPDRYNIPPVQRNT